MLFFRKTVPPYTIVLPLIEALMLMFGTEIVGIELPAAVELRIVAQVLRTGKASAAARCRWRDPPNPTATLLW